MMWLLQCCSVIFIPWPCRLTSDDKETQLRCVRAWTEWELSLLSLINNPPAIESKLTDEKWMLTKALIET